MNESDPENAHVCGLIEKADSAEKNVRLDLGITIE
jgi:hypothetical protein